MAAYTSVDDDTLRAATSAAGIAMPSSVEPVSAGSVNSNYKLSSDGSDYLLRIYEDRRGEDVRWEWELLDELCGLGMRVPVRLGDADPNAITIDGKPVSIFVWDEGQPICQKGVEPSHVQQIGGVLGALHRATEARPEMRASTFSTTTLVERASKADVVAHPEIEEPLRRSAELLQRLELAQPSVVIHGDLFRDNALFVGRPLSVVLDWDCASGGDPMYDLGVALLAWCFGDALDVSLMKEMVRGYVNVRDVSTLEQSRLWDAMRIACARFTITRVLDFHLQDTTGRMHRDYARFVARLAALDALGAGSLTGELFG